MRINGTEYIVQDVSRVLTVPDSIVVPMNKIGDGHGEAKLYFGTKVELEQFFLGYDVIPCFFLKSDLLTYMQTAHDEYMFPSQNYAGREQMANLWQERLGIIQNCQDIIQFNVVYQRQIQGPRGYINSDDAAYNLFRLLSLPLISYISIMRLQAPSGQPVFYWKLFVDFDAIEQNRAIALVLNYGGRNQPVEHPLPPTPVIETPQTGRNPAAQARYKAQLLEECPFCPITGISDERILIASHIKPFAVSNACEAYDPQNGFILSPLYDKLFDQGFISFDSNRCMMVSDWLSPRNQVRCNVENGRFIQRLPWNDQREQYLIYHRQFIFKG
ncbi:MAG: HNH endonuclease [Lentisphaeria bacterium]|nr:HNH endonuclease [Lentisphaeria bacterium]